MEINPRIFLSFPWQMVFTTLSVRVFLINILHVSLFLPNVTYSHFAKYNTKPFIHKNHSFIKDVHSKRTHRWPTWPCFSVSLSGC